MKTVTLVVRIEGHAKPVMLSGVVAGGIPPSELHVSLTRAQLTELAKALAEELAGEKTVTYAGKFLGAVLDEFVSRKVRGRRMK